MLIILNMQLYLACLLSYCIFIDLVLKPALCTPSNLIFAYEQNAILLSFYLEWFRLDYFAADFWYGPCMCRVQMGCNVVQCIVFEYFYAVFDIDGLHMWHMARAYSIYTLCLKKVPTFKLSATLSYLNQFLKLFLLLRKLMKFATQMFNISHHTLLMLLHYLGKFKSSDLLQIRKNAQQNALIFTCIHLM